MFTLLKVVGERARSPTTFVMITNQKCQLYRKLHRPMSWLGFYDLIDKTERVTILVKRPPVGRSTLFY